MQVKQPVARVNLRQLILVLIKHNASIELEYPMRQLQILSNRWRFADNIVRSFTSGNRNQNLHLSKIQFLFPVSLTKYKYKFNVAKFLLNAEFGADNYVKRRSDHSLTTAKSRKLHISEIE